MTSYLEKAFQFDIQIRGSKLHAREGAVLAGEDIKEGVVYEKNGVTVTAFNVDHGNVPTFGYRIDYGRHSVVISGDTGFSENLIKFSKGVDLLIHEVLVAGKEELRTSEQLRNLNKFHTIPEQAGEVFTRIKPKLAVFTHIQGGKHTVDDLIALTRRTYAGPLEAGEDLLAIEVGDEIEVRRVTPSLP
jgi:ribonuclease Z